MPVHTGAKEGRQQGLAGLMRMGTAPCGAVLGSGVYRQLPAALGGWRGRANHRNRTATQGGLRTARLDTVCSEHWHWLTV